MNKEPDSENENILAGSVKLSQKEFRILAGFIESELGIKMPDIKKTMVEARLQKRLRVLRMRSFEDYCRHVFSPEGEQDELIHMIDVVTTNKTDFFRESGHFDYMVKETLPTLIKDFGAGTRRPLGVWSAGCSTGEEPYTLAMVLSDYKETIGRNFRFFILATDISTRVLHVAQKGVYEESKTEAVPQNMKKSYLLRSKDRTKGVVRIVPELRELVHFRRLNFMDEDFGFREKMDIIFCRNVIIYFDRHTQEKLLNKFATHLNPGGYLFMGHSETLSGMNLPYRPVGPTVYRKVGQGVRQEL